MKKVTPAPNPDAYVAALSGWQKEFVTALRDAVLEAAPGVDERIKWTHLVYFSNGPVLLIRAEEERVLFGFWRGKRLLQIEPRMTRRARRYLSARGNSRISCNVPHLQRLNHVRCQCSMPFPCALLASFPPGTRERIGRRA